MKTKPSPPQNGLRQVIERPLTALVPAPNNPRTHSDEQIDAVARSIRRFGFINPVLVTAAGQIVAGHARVLAARRLGLETVPCIALEHLKPDDVRAYVIADNELALRSGWDEELLRVELSGLKALGYDVTLSGFASKEIRELLAVSKRMGKSDPDEVPPAPAKAKTKPGDLWILGEHRLLCGDSTDSRDVDRAFGGEAPVLMVTDPPYGVDYEPSWRQEALTNGNGSGAIGEVKNDDRADWREVWRLFPGSVAYVWHGGLHSAVVAQSLEASGFLLRAQIIWVKQRPPISRGAYHWAHEPCFYAVRPDDPGGKFEDGWRFAEEHAVGSYAVRDGEGARWQGGRKQSTLWSIPVVKNNTGHGTQKPIECMRRPILNNSAAGDLVFDPFTGSGTTLIAAEQSDRRFCGLEVSPVYCDVSVKRWEEFTGLKAKLDAAQETKPR